MLTNFYNVSKYIKDNNQKVAALFREVRLLFMIIFVCPLYKSSYVHCRLQFSVIMSEIYFVLRILLLPFFISS